MKKLILAAFALTTAASVFAQGTVVLNNNLSGNRAYIYGPSPTTPSLSLFGNAANGLPAGTTDYAGAGMLPLAGNRFFVQLIGANGQNQPDASLVPVGGTTTFRTGSAAGLIASATMTLTGDPAIPAGAAFATFQIVAWDNISGQYANWAQADIAWKAGLIAAGHSTTFSVANIGSEFVTPPNLNNITPLSSFNLYFIPEPSSMALAGLGAAALMIFRRRK